MSPYELENLPHTLKRVRTQSIFVIRLEVMPLQLIGLYFMLERQLLSAFRTRQGNAAPSLVRCYDVWSLVCRAKSFGCPGTITAR
jgi:hypothetical protein